MLSRGGGSRSEKQQASRCSQSSGRFELATGRQESFSSHPLKRFNPISSSSLTKGFHPQFFWYKEESIIILFPKQENGNSS
ncbi:hypothetical protein V6N13_143937 [Hibiscus sabdariffa]